METKNYTADQPLNYLSSEMNHILGEAAINASLRYSNTCDGIRKLNLNEALALVPTKDRCFGKILYFLTKNKHPRVEAWMFAGLELSHWDDIRYWLPISFRGMMATYYTKDEVDHLLKFKQEVLGRNSATSPLYVKHKKCCPGSRKVYFGLDTGKLYQNTTVNISMNSTGSHEFPEQLATEKGFTPEVRNKLSDGAINKIRFSDDIILTFNVILPGLDSNMLTAIWNHPGTGLTYQSRLTLYATGEVQYSVAPLTL